MSYKNILIDMGNVIMDFSPDYVLSNYTKDIKVINLLKHSIFFNDMWSKLDKGTINEEDVYNNVISNLDSKYHELVKNILDTWYLYKTQSSKMYTILSNLKEKGYKLYLCSNVAQSFYKYENDIDAFKFLDGKVLSSDILISKPDIKYFEYVLNKYNLNADECFFIDDSLENIKSAYKVGIDGYWYNGNADLFEKFLKEVGIL